MQREKILMAFLTLILGISAYLVGPTVYMWANTDPIYDRAIASGMNKDKANRLYLDDHLF